MTDPYPNFSLIISEAQAFLSAERSTGDKSDAIRTLIQHLTAALVEAKSELDATDIDPAWIESTYDRGKAAGIAEAVASRTVESWKHGDRVRYSGPTFNKEWDNSRTGTVIGVAQTIDIHWDHGPINYGQSAKHFTKAE